MENTIKNISYSLSKWVRVRKETFSLLFYNGKEAKLTFVKSGMLIDVSNDKDKIYRLNINNEIKEKEKEKAHLFIKILLKKGLINET